MSIGSGDGHSSYLDAKFSKHLCHAGPARDFPTLATTRRAAPSLPWQREALPAAVCAIAQFVRMGSTMVRDALGWYGSVARAAGELGVTRQGLSKLMARLQADRFDPDRDLSSHAPSG